MPITLFTFIVINGSPPLETSPSIACWKSRFNIALTSEKGVHVSLLGRHCGSSQFSSLSLNHSSSITSFTKEESSVFELRLNRSTNFCLPFFSLSKHLYKMEKPVLHKKICKLEIQVFKTKVKFSGGSEICGNKACKWHLFSKLVKLYKLYTCA